MKDNLLDEMDRERVATAYAPRPLSGPAIVAMQHRIEERTVRRSRRGAIVLAACTVVAAIGVYGFWSLGAQIPPSVNVEAPLTQWEADVLFGGEVFDETQDDEELPEDYLALANAFEL